MKREEHYMDQLFQDHFDDFEKSPSDEVWEGIVKHGTMANGKPLALPGGWKSGITLLFTVLLCIVLLSGSDASLVAKQAWKDQLNPTSQPQKKLALAEVIDTVHLDSHKVRYSAVEESTEAEKGAFVYSSTIIDEREVKEEIQPAEPVTEERNVSGLNFDFDQLLEITQFPIPKTLADSASAELSSKARRNLKRDLFSTTYYKKPKGGHWFVTGGFVLDSSYGNGSGYADGLSFGAGKYIDKNSFLEVALRGVWSYGFNLRATYTRLLLPGKIRPFIQGGLAWDSELDFRLGAGIMYEPSVLSKWRIYVSANYEKGSRILERNSTVRPVFELGIQLRLSGTEPLLSDNNWMNTVPHYKLPRDWYLEGSSNFALFDKTQVTRISFYAGKNLNRRMYARGGLRLGRDRITLPVQLQYHAVVRQKLRFGVYGGPSVDITGPGLGAELGLIAYYEIVPGWSLYVAPVILDNSEYKDRIFETGIRYYLGKKRK